MRRLIILALFAGLVSAPPAVAGQTTPDPVQSRTRCNGFNLLDKLAATDPVLHARVVANADALENGGAIFWKLERPGRAPSYLFGTVHLSDRRITELTEPAKAAIGGATALMIENAAQPSGPTMRNMDTALKSAVFTDGRSLETLLSKEEFEKVRQSTGGMPAELLRPYRPWMVSLMLSASACERRRLQSGHRVLDMVIAERARVSGIPIAGLETTEQQIAALASVPEDEQLDMLRANIALVEESENLRETMVQLYLARRVGALWELQLALAEKAGIPATAFASFHKALIVDRNRTMRDAALPYLEEGGAFLAVGALHLPGKTGLVALFRESGYTVTALE